MEPCSADPESVEYWKKQAKLYEQRANDLQQELDEYTESSAQLEKELEASLAQADKQISDLKHQNNRLTNETALLRNKLERSQHEANALESEIQTLKIDKDKKALYIRELEQKNDDLERGQRVITESVSCIEALLNQAYERNAVLENEVDEIEVLRVRLQRANDEARDLKQELKVVALKGDEDDNENAAPAPPANGHAPPRAETETQTTLMAPVKREINGNAMSPSSRVTTLNIVGDLLRKVGLERFLCPECGKVKCVCAAAESGAPEPAAPPAGSDVDVVEYRQARRASGPQPEPRPQRKSEQPFVRAAAAAADGRLRRSFAVRSREGIENLLGLTKKSDAHRTKR